MLIRLKTVRERDEKAFMLLDAAWLSMALPLAHTHTQHTDTRTHVQTVACM